LPESRIGSKQLKILLVTGIYPPDLGGPATYIPLLEEYLSINGVDFQTITLTDGQNVKKPKIIKISRGLNKILRVVLTIVEIRKAARQCDYILANGLFEETAIATMFMQKRVIMKVVGDPIWERYRNKTGLSVGIEEFQILNPRISYYIQRTALIWSLNRADNIVTPSNQLKQFIENWRVKTPVVLIPNGTPCRSIVVSNKLFDVLVVSRLVSWKNIDCVIRSLLDTKLRLGIAGTGPELQKLKEIARHARNEVTFLGDLDEESVVYALNHSAIYILNSDYEGLSFALINAMMLGKAIVVSNTEGNTQVIQDQSEGLVVVARDEEQILAAINELSNNSTLAHNLGQAARTKALNRFCLEERLTDMFNLLVKGR
jgi:glycosyltransferase involved in cell wall biosynthesis